MASDASLALPLQTAVPRAPNGRVILSLASGRRPQEPGRWEERTSLGVPSSLNLLWPFCSRRVSSVPPDPVAQGQLLLWAPVTPVVPLSLVLGVVVRCLLSTLLWQETRARTKPVRLSYILWDQILSLF